jgi:hypothetical protein
MLSELELVVLLLRDVGAALAVAIAWCDALAAAGSGCLMEDVVILEGWIIADADAACGSGGEDDDVCGMCPGMMHEPAAHMLGLADAGGRAA